MKKDRPQKNTVVRIKDIALKADVSTGTVDRVIHNRGRVAEDVKNRVLKRCFPFQVTVSSLLIKPDVVPDTASSLKCSIEIL